MTDELKENTFYKISTPYLSDNTCRGFCTSQAQWGQPLTFTGRDEGGFPEITLYDGTNFCGVTNETVVDIDSTRGPIGCQVMTGGLINITRRGITRIRNILFKNPEDIDFNKYVKPTKNGWKVQNKKTKKPVGIIQLVAEHYTEINLFQELTNEF